MNLAEIRKDIILFKDETLKIIREMGKQLFEGIKQKSNELDSKIAEIESKLSKYKESNKRMYDIILEQKIYIEKIKNLNDFRSKAETRLLSFDIKLSNFFSELVSFKNRYDKIIVDNLTIPGIIGVSCKYNSIAEYISDNINKNKLLHAEQDKLKNEVNFLLKNNEKFEKSINGAVDVSVSTSKIYADARTKEMRDFILKNIEKFNNILADTKADIEGNVIKIDDVQKLIKHEIKNSKKEIMNILDEHKKQRDKDNKEKDKDRDKSKFDRIGNSSEIKKELKEIKKNFNELKTDMENQMVNAMKLIKEQENTYNKNNKRNNNTSNDNNNLTQKPIVSKDNVNEYYDNGNKENITHSSKNNTENYYKTLQNSETRFYHTINKEKNEQNVENKHIEETNNFKISETSKKHNKIKSLEKALGLKSSKENNKLKGIILNPIYLNPEKNEHNHIETESPIMKGKEINSPNNENQKYKNISRNVDRYRTFSENKYNFRKNFFKESNNITNIEDNKMTSKIYLNIKESEKEKQGNKKYAIRPINSDNLKDQENPINNDIYSNNENPKTSSNEERNSLFRTSFKGENSDSDNNNIAIRLMKNKKQMIDDFKLDYVKQYYPTLNLYKNYYNKKMNENKEKERLKENIKIPKKISPAFGRTAYTEFVKPNNNFNSKKYNGNVNIVIDSNFRNIIQERKYFYTINNDNIKHRSFSKDKRKKIKKEEIQKNKSV